MRNHSVMDGVILPKKVQQGLIMKYFVLNPTKKGSYGKASKAAIYEYAKFIRHKNNALATDLCKWMEGIK